MGKHCPLGHCVQYASSPMDTKMRQNAASPVIIYIHPSQCSIQNGQKWMRLDAGGTSSLVSCCQAGSRLSHCCSGQWIRQSLPRAHSKLNGQCGRQLSAQQPRTTFGHAVFSLAEYSKSSLAPNTMYGRPMSLA